MNDLKFFKKGDSYLVLKYKTKGKKGLFYCEVCGGERELNIHCVEVSGRYKTCGCCSSHTKPLDTFYCKSTGYFKTITGYIISRKIAKGYLMSTYKGITDYTHRLVANEFIPNPYNYSDINHINGVKTDNRIENLEWCSRSYNIKHAYKNGLNKGSLNNISEKRKLSDEECMYVINNKGTLKEMAKKFNVSISTISDIRNFKTYKNLNV